MIIPQLQPGDVVFLDSVESFMRKQGVPENLDPQTRIALTEQYRATLYSACATALVDRICDRILGADMTTDSEARALWEVLYKHSMDPEFISFVTQAINDTNADSGKRGRIGALFSKLLDRYVTEEQKKLKASDGKKKDGSTPDIDLSPVKHIQVAMETLLGGAANAIQMQCGNLSHPSALFIAACLAMNDSATIKQILESDLPITANIFPNGKNGSPSPDSLIRAALLLQKSEIPTKLTKNQEAFLTSLRDWVFTMLENIPGNHAMQTCYSYLVGVYKSTKPDVSPYYIQIKDCGTSYSNLLQVAKQIVNK